MSRPNGRPFLLSNPIPNLRPSQRLLRTTIESPKQGFPLSAYRRNWTFAGSDEGGRRAAAIYTLIATVKLNDIDPQAWLAGVLARLPDYPAKRIHKLMPWNWRSQKRRSRRISAVSQTQNEEAFSVFLMSRLLACSSPVLARNMPTCSNAVTMIELRCRSVMTNLRRRIVL